MGMKVELKRCESLGPQPERYQCGLPASHGEPHSALIPSGMPWFGKTEPTYREKIIERNRQADAHPRLVTALRIVEHELAGHGQQADTVALLGVIAEALKDEQ